MKDEIITCVDCGKKFELTPGWKKLVADQPDIKLPKRCYDCRQKRKAWQERKEKRSFGSDKF